MATPKTLNIFQRINAVMRDVAYLKKDGVNKFQKNKFVSHDAVVALFHDPMVEHGIALTVEFLSNSCREVEEKSGKVAHFTEILARVWFVNIDDPADRTYMDSLGHGSDYNDLSPGKAMSYFKKYALLNMFLVETGDKDCEHDSMGRDDNTKGNQGKAKQQGTANTNPNAKAQASKPETPAVRIFNHCDKYFHVWNKHLFDSDLQMFRDAPAMTQAVVRNIIGEVQSSALTPKDANTIITHKDILGSLCSTQPPETKKAA